MQASQVEFANRGIATIVISFAEPAKLVQYQQYHQWPFPLLADPDRRAYREFSLPRIPWRRVFAPATLKLYFRLLRDGRQRRNYGKEDLRQSGGDFLIDRAGNVLFAHRSREPADRPGPAQLLGEIDRIMARPARS